MNSDLVLKVQEQRERASGCSANVQINPSLPVLGCWSEWETIYDQGLKQAIAFHNFGRGPSKGELLGGSETVKSADVVSTYQAAVQGHQ